MFKSSEQKPFKNVPFVLIIFFILSLTIQVSWHKFSVTTQITKQALSTAPPLQHLKLTALGEPEVLGKILMLWIQSLDNQPGISLSLNDLNYDQLITWLNMISQLDERSEYPLFSAAHFYINVNNSEKQRKILSFILQRFKQNPNRYWRWLAHASIIAKHRLHDDVLALHYAQLLRKQATGIYVPNWAKQLEISILEEKGEYESIRLLIGGLISEGKITDPHELFFLNQKLESMKDKQK